MKSAMRLAISRAWEGGCREQLERRGSGFRYRMAVVREDCWRGRRFGVSLAYMLPHGKREAAIRFAVGIICGMVFGGAAGVKIAETLALGDALGRAELMLMGSAAASLAAWSALGVFRRFAERLKQAPLPGVLPAERNMHGEI
ncbi:conserved hypothetical protein [Brucella pinnipedialis M163/99/10]|nr:conserved hypothetical protein [Brucella pinnipedialis M163/99/10]